MGLHPEGARRMVELARRNLGEVLDAGAEITALSANALSRNEAQDHYNAAIRGMMAPGERIACAPGCAACCHNTVLAAPAEVLVIAAWLRASLEPGAHAALLDRVRGAAERDRGRPVRGRVGPCPLLAGRRCTVYPVRPGACAGHLSGSRTACEGDLDKRRRGLPGKPIPIVPESAEIAAAMRLGADLAAVEHGLQADDVELAPALAAAMADFEGTFEAWRAGREVFAPVASEGQPRAADRARAAARTLGITAPVR
ncbi:YkgJ family cysteine cluster protein [Arenibaculum pallidiluteum]|uniref:YkgJ family cysteine cluster protein n=1 Tax=Arenibaculum pallidiluteum TaxID=2812559 RepID=UPI001A970D05|nr:YkgJ family cysteine cluster protein [Arenibaculum pallidiluteum]